jgi:hypothetical protein
MARRIYYKVQIGKGSKRGTRKYLSTHFRTKARAEQAAERFSAGRVVKRHRRATHRHGGR